VPRPSSEDGDRVGGEALVGDRIDPFGAGLGPAMVQHEERAPFERAADAPVVRAELVDDRLIPVRHL
jgi:hypothetical protein